MGKGEKKKLEKVRSAARQEVGKLYIIAACLALLVCGTCSCSHPKRKKSKKQDKTTSKQIRK
ncbi:unnamed protein product [Miscanthus lutarioriparius]|uniref:Uncharacterized protein n=1 Tax=Miscanthus lutarioriparius TaxID=422564 RepID=A0A811RQJ9_9POAL|nr:unnamed protein product [Miscanthus lutarioriparius]